MTDGQSFLFVFILIYLSDCLVWLPPSGYAVLAFQGRRFLVRRPAMHVHAVRKGFAILQPLPPFGTVFAGQAWPLSMDRSGLAPLSRENPNPGPSLAAPPGAHFLAWEDIDSIGADESRLLVNGKPFAICATAAAALDLSRVLDRLRSIPYGGREAAIAKLFARNLNVRRPARKARLFFKSVLPLRVNASILFASVFLLVPYSYWRFEDDPPFFLTLLAVWILMCRIVVEFWMLHRRFYPSLSSERWTHAVLSILFPHYALRSIDVLSKGFLAESHPLAVAAALAVPEEFGRFADQVLRDARHPVPCPDEDPLAMKTAETSRVRFFLPLVEALSSTAPALRDLPEEDRTVSPSEVSECPRCRIPYDRTGLVCQDCGGIPTVPLGGAPTGAP